MSDSPTARLDATGLVCPLPVLRTKKALRGLAPGAVLEVLATDPSSLEDMRSFCAVTGDELLDSSQDGDVFRYLIRKKTD